MLGNWNKFHHYDRELSQFAEVKGVSYKTLDWIHVAVISKYHGHGSNKRAVPSSRMHINISKINKTETRKYHLAIFIFYL